MLQTNLGRQVDGWSEKAKAEYKIDLDKITQVPLNVLRPVVGKLAKTLPACNSFELAVIEAERHSLENAGVFTSAVSSVSFLFENIGDDESPRAVVEDLVSIGIVSKDAAAILISLLGEFQPYRESAKAAAAYIRIGAPLFVGIRGTVDIRLRFHEKAGDLITTQSPNQLHGAQQVVMVDLIISGYKESDEFKEEVISFLMDENDLSYMKRFVRNMERELELSKGLLRIAENQTNG